MARPRLQFLPLEKRLTDGLDSEHARSSPILYRPLRHYFQKWNAPNSLILGKVSNCRNFMYSDWIGKYIALEKRYIQSSSPSSSAGVTGWGTERRPAIRPPNDRAEIRRALLVPRHTPARRRTSPRKASRYFGESSGRRPNDLGRNGRGFFVPNHRE